MGLGIILAIGPQNIFIIKESLQNGRPYFAAVLCASCDALLIASGTYILSSLIDSESMWFEIIKWIGIGFLLYYSLINLLSAAKGVENKKKIHDDSKGLISRNHSENSFYKIIVLSLTFSLLNPHAYIDTILILGNVGSRIPGVGKIPFVLGSSAASYFWFLLTAYAGLKLSNLFKVDKFRRAFDTLVAIGMLFVAYGLYYF
jgi:L-lysine exporter family protein LysE/ArgO